MIPRRILFVDDNAAAREGYCTYLANHGFDVMPAASGEEALTLAMLTPPDVIVLDLGLPDVDGWDVARRLKLDPATAQIPIIAFTAATLPHERASALRAGCDRYLAKPCSPAELVEAIQRSLATL